MKNIDISPHFHSSERVSSIKLIQSMLDTIADSISTFRPSKSLAFISLQQDQIIRPDLTDQDEIGSESDDSSSRYGTIATVPASSAAAAEIDLVISGGGFKGYFMCGAAHVLTKELAKRNMKINRIAGTSAGAWAGLFICCGFTASHWMKTYFACKDRPDGTIHEVYTELFPWVKMTIPEDAFIICTNRLFVSITVLTRYGPVNKIISEYSSNEDLLEACLASSTLPYLTERRGCRMFRGEYVVDGGLTNNIPVFTDGVRRQLVFRLFDVEYPWRLLINAQDTCIESLILRGAMLMARFLEGQAAESIAWLEKKQSKGHLVRKPGYWVRAGIIAPLTLGGIFMYRGTGLRDLLRQCNQILNDAKGFSDVGSCTVIPFSEASKVLGTAPVSYFCGAVFAATVDFLRSLNVLL